MEKTLRITEEQAKELYGNPKAFDVLLENNFGKKTFCKSFQELVDSYEDACKITGEMPMNEAEMIKLGFYPREIARRKLETIYAAANILNDNWKADFSNPDQPKYFNWPAWRSGAFRVDDTGYADTNASIGSRLCCGIEEDEDYIGKTFESLFNEFLS